jgi:hypothetical protein
MRRLEADKFIKSNRVMNTLFKKFKFVLAKTHLAIELEHALSCIVKSIKTHRFELQILLMASQKVKSFLL